MTVLKHFSPKHLSEITDTDKKIMTDIGLEVASYRLSKIYVGFIIETGVTGHRIIETAFNKALKNRSDSFNLSGIGKVEMPAGYDSFKDFINYEKNANIIESFTNMYNKYIEELNKIASKEIIEFQVDCIEPLWHGKEPITRLMITGSNLFMLGFKTIGEVLNDSLELVIKKSVNNGLSEIYISVEIGSQKTKKMIKLNDRRLKKIATGGLELRKLLEIEELPLFVYIVEAPTRENDHVGLLTGDSGRFPVKRRVIETDDHQDNIDGAISHTA